MGSKNKSTLQQKKAGVIEELLRCFGIKTVACRRCNISRTQFYEWLKQDLEFAYKVTEIEEGFIDYVEANLIEMVQQKDRTATMFYLKAKGKSRGYK